MIAGEIGDDVSPDLAVHNEPVDQHDHGPLATAVLVLDYASRKLDSLHPMPGPFLIDRSSGEEPIVKFVGPDVNLLSGVRDFFAGAAQTLRETDYADACPIATVALEVSSTNEELRQACADVFDAWIEGGTERFVAAGISTVICRAFPVAGNALLRFKNSILHS